MALIPAAGFLVKQSLAIWAPLYCVYLLFFDSPRSLLRLMAFGVATFASLGCRLCRLLLCSGGNHSGTGRWS